MRTTGRYFPVSRALYSIDVVILLKAKLTLNVLIMCQGMFELLNMKRLVDDRFTLLELLAIVC